MKAARVLIVEDDPLLLEMVERLLAQLGHAVVGAGNAEQALATLATRRFDLVLLDQVLPGITGLQALRRVAAASAAPVYLMSGFTGEELATDARLLGASGFLAKPLDLAALQTLIATLPEKA